MNKIFFIISLFIFLTYENVLLAYIGPGLALGTIVVSIGIILLILFLIIAILYYPIKKLFQKYKNKKDWFKLFWCPHTDSNREPIDYKSIALPIELWGLECDY